MQVITRRLVNQQAAIVGRVVLIVGLRCVGGKIKIGKTINNGLIKRGVAMMRRGVTGLVTDRLGGVDHR